MNHLARPPYAPGGLQTKPATPRNREEEQRQHVYTCRSRNTVRPTNNATAIRRPMPQPAAPTPSRTASTYQSKQGPWQRQRSRPARDIRQDENHAPCAPIELVIHKLAQVIRRKKCLDHDPSKAQSSVPLRRCVDRFRSRQLDNPPAPRNPPALRDHFAGKQAWNPIQI